MGYNIGHRQLTLAEHPSLAPLLLKRRPLVFVYLPILQNFPGAVGSFRRVSYKLPVLAGPTRQPPPPPNKQTNGRCVLPGFLGGQTKAINKFL